MEKNIKIVTIQIPELEKIVEKKVLKVLQLFNYEKEKEKNTNYTKKEAAEKLRMSYNTLKRRIKEGKIKERPDGKIPKASIDYYLSL